MPATLRLLSWNMQNYGTSKFNRFDLGEVIATVMQAYAIDICALIEISNNGHANVRASIVTELANLGYRAGWRHTFVNVGDEGVAFVWHEPAQGANAFRRFAYTNNAADPIAGKVVRNTGGARIYFPKTNTPWNSLPGAKSEGRRAAYCAFETNDGNPARRFTLLNIHTPFNVNTQIQAYTARLYATAREAATVDTVDGAHALAQARANSLAHMQADLDPRIQAALGAPIAGLAQRVNDVAFNVLLDQVADGTPLDDAFRGAMLAGVDAAVAGIGNRVNAGTSLTAAGRLMDAAAAAAAMSAAYLAASVGQPTAPPAATASAQAAADAARDDAVGNAAYIRPAKSSVAAKKAAIRSAARTAVEGTVPLFTFPAPPTAALDGAVLAGDFNVDFPDTTDYTQIPGAAARLGGNAYTALLALAAPRPAAITGRTTRIGPTAFNGQRIYRLLNPVPIQHTHPAQPGYVPLDVTSLAGVDLMGNAAWVQALRGLAQAQGANWSNLETNYGQAIYDAFDSTTVINDSEFYRASFYDNLFVRGATVVSSGIVDVFSELGSWPGAAPRWAQALGRLNQIAHDQVNTLNGGMPAQVTYYPGPVTYDLTTAVDDAEQAAVFFDKYVSDHLPVWVEIQI